jgi:cellulose synthase/poly-beta-1,6-N-acetylglucosamine synthase-like glycosyltransferase
MSFGLPWTILIPYYVVLGILALYGIHRSWLLVLWWKHRSASPEAPPTPDEWPVVTVQLPLYNEMYVAARLIDAVCRLDYPQDRLEIQVLDDSTDETRKVVAGKVAEHRARGFDIHHLHRTDRTGFKAGALAAGTERARGRFLAVFDADFVPPPHFLRRVIPHFLAPEEGEKVGMVQTRWDHLNRSYSLLTRIQAILLDGHFLIEHTARHRSGRFFNFNGTAGVWRREVIEDAGGWEHDTLTEDLDLSYRAQLAGWRFLYLPEVAVPSELPVDVNGFKTQQYRWARGSIQTGRKLLRRILRSRLPWRIKAEAFIHLTNNVSYFLMVLLSLLVFPAMALRQDASSRTLLLVDVPLFVAATVSVLAFYVASQIAVGDGWRRRLTTLPALMGLGVGLSINNGRAVVAGLFGRVGVFHRTPKYNIGDQGGTWRTKRYRVGRNIFALVEVLFALYLSGCLVWAVREEMWYSLPFLLLFVHGHCYIVLLTLLSNLSWGQGESGLEPVFSARDSL